MDNRGGRATLCVASALLCVAVHLALGLTTLPASVLLLGLGLGYSVFAAVIWPSVAYVVDSKALGTAYGVVTALQNFGLFAIPLLVGGVHEATAQWRLLPASITPPQPWAGVELFFAALGGLGVVAGAALYADPRVRLGRERARDDVLEPRGAGRARDRRGRPPRVVLLGAPRAEREQQREPTHHDAPGISMRPRAEHGPPLICFKFARMP